jgi:CHAT domain-containing protein
MSQDDLEIRQLKEAIVSLREELEKARFEEREHIQEAKAAANDEVRQLRASVVELRDKLDIREIEHAEKLREIELRCDHERAELHHTISMLRDKLEEVTQRMRTESR